MASKPNLIFLMPDQLRADFLSCYGADFIHTPHIDSLAQKGVLYQNAYTPSPLCVPARCVLLTGCNALKTGVLTNEEFLRPDLESCGIHTWPQLLEGAGYTTAAIGKMHFYPWDIHMGFRDRVISEDKRWLLIEDDYQAHLKKHGLHKLHGDEHPGYHENKGAISNKIPWEHSWDHFVGEQACQYIRRHPRDNPFAMMVGFPGPHCPYDPVTAHLEEFDEAKMPASIPEVPGNAPALRQQRIDSNRLAWNGVDYTHFSESQKKKVRAHYAALVKQIDFEVGAILDALKETGQLENTIVIFASDHGDHLGDHNLIGKGDFYQSSIKVPLLVRLPAATSGTICNDLVSIEDITATLLQLGGCQLPDYMDSQPLPLPGLPAPAARQSIFGFLASGCMHLDGEWKLVKYASGTTLLFNLLEDPLEQDNRVDDPACLPIYRRLDAELTGQILDSVHAGHAEKKVAHNLLCYDVDFGQKGWQRPYPQRSFSD